jgi:hypothetical protein
MLWRFIDNNNLRCGGLSQVEGVLVAPPVLPEGAVALYTYSLPAGRLFFGCFTHQKQGFGDLSKVDFTAVDVLVACILHDRV